jgi:hypothetical protein
VKIALHLHATGAKGPLQVARRDFSRKRSKPEPEFLLVPPGLLEAAEYVLRVVDLPRVQGPKKEVARDRYTCQNPRCRLQSLRVHPHHLHQRPHGGTDDTWNIMPFCPPCHLRGIHSGRMSAVRIDDWIVVVWADKQAALLHSPVADLVREPVPRRSIIAA